MYFSALPAVPTSPAAIRREINRRWAQHVWHALNGRPDSAECERREVDVLLDRLAVARLVHEEQDPSVSQG